MKVGNVSKTMSLDKRGYLRISVVEVLGVDCMTFSCQHQNKHIYSEL